MPRSQYVGEDIPTYGVSTPRHFIIRVGLVFFREAYTVRPLDIAVITKNPMIEISVPKRWMYL